MRQEKGSKSSLFMIELIIVLFFFILAAAVCTQIFAKSFSLSRSARELSHGQSLCSSLWEAIDGTDGSPEALLTLFPTGEENHGGFCVYYDQDFQPCSKENAVYTLLTRLKTDNRTKQGVITFSRNETLLYSLDIFSRTPLTGKEALS